MRGLVLSAHPVPSLVVTALAVLLAVDADAGATRCVVVGAAVLAGQCSIGWSNDALDADRDAAVGRTDKPVATGAAGRRTVWLAAGTAVAAAVALTALLGWRALVVHLIGIAAAWAYNLGLKRTVVSPLPYAVFFGLLPAVITRSGPGHPWPAGWLLAAGALLGVAAHLGNVLPDLESDAATGIRGLPHQLGRVACTVLAGAILIAVAGLLVLGPTGRPGAARWAGLIAAVLLAVVGATAGRRRPASRLPFIAIMLAALIDVVLLIASGSSLR